MDSDSQLIAQAGRGDEAACRELWANYAPRLDALIFRLCGDFDLAADIAQEVWVQIFRALPSFRGDSKFITWAHRIAVNRTLNALRGVSRSDRMVDIDEVSGDLFRDGYEDVNSIFLGDTIRDAIKHLSPGARSVFVLHDIEGHTHEEVAQIMGITSGGSKSQLFKARAKLRGLLGHLREDSEKSETGKSHVATQ